MAGWSFPPLDFGLTLVPCFAQWDIGSYETNRSLKYSCVQLSFPVCASAIGMRRTCSVKWMPRQPGPPEWGQAVELLQPTSSPRAQSGAVQIGLQLRHYTSPRADICNTECENKCLLDTKFHGFAVQKLTEGTMAKSLIHFKLIILHFWEFFCLWGIGKGGGSSTIFYVS